MEVNSHVWSMNEYRTEKSSNSIRKEVGVTADHELNMNPQCPAVVEKANILLSCINKRIICQVHEIMLPLHSEVSVSQTQELQLCVPPQVPNSNSALRKSPGP